MEPEEPWEALDLELEESLLVPCKRKNSLSLTKDNKSVRPSKQFVGSCYLKSQVQIHSNSTRSIPGPAGAVQSAMQRKSLMGVGEEPISTQEYIRKAVEDPCIEDEDFSRHPWLFAVDFVRCQGLVGSDGVAIGTPLSEIKSGMNMDKVSQIVAIVKSTTPNGLGDLMVTLKDPTGTIDASIHRRVLTEGEFKKDISVGAVLILQKVAVFSPSRSTHYLNITLSNIVKVISKDPETPSIQNYPALTVKHAAQNPDGESGEKPCIPPKISSVSQGKMKGITSYLRRNANIKGTAQNTKQTEKVQLSTSSSFYDCGGSNSHNFDVEKEPLVVRQDPDGMKEVVFGTGTNDNDLGILLGEQPDTSNQTARTEGIMSNLRQNANGRGSVLNPKQMEKGNLAPPGIFFGDGGSISQNSVVEKEPLVVTQDVDIMKEVAVGTGTTGNAEVFLFGEQTRQSSQAARGNLVEEIRCSGDAAGFVQVPNTEENGNFNGAKNHRQLLISKGSISQWTDEQLDELLLFD